MIIFSWVLVSRGAYRLPANRVESSSTSGESTEVCCHVLRTRKVHVSLFHWARLPVVRIDFVRIDSNRQVPQTNRLSLGVLDMDASDQWPIAPELLRFL